MRRFAAQLAARLPVRPAAQPATQVDAHAKELANTQCSMHAITDIMLATCARTLPVDDACLADLDELEERRLCRAQWLARVQWPWVELGGWWELSGGAAR